MITVTAAIIEKSGLILAARRKTGCHLAGSWEFPGGKIEPGETAEGCLVRELREEFGIGCTVGEFLGESVFDYGTKIIRLLGYRVQHLSGSFQCRAHDRISWLPVPELPALRWAPADVYFVEKLLEEYHVDRTLAYYRANAQAYVRETVGLDLANAMRQHFVELLMPNSLILDLGCGSGRDSRFFLDQGHRVMPVDAVEEIARLAAQHIRRPVRVQMAEELSETETYDGIWACASLLHIPKARIHVTFQRIINSMKKQGIWYMSFKSGNTQHLDQKQRFFNNYSIAAMTRLLQQFPQVRVIEISESRSLRNGHDQLWLNVLAAKN